MLLDSNIIIYAAKPEYGELREFIALHAPAVSTVSMVEVLGYHLLGDAERQYFKEFFATAKVLAISDSVITQAIRLRQTRRMSLGDSLIGGTALAHQLTLVTKNTSDFEWIDDLTLLDPLE